MKILKLKTNKVRDISLNIRNHCDMCGTKVLLENGSDIILIRNKYPYDLISSDFIFGYRCLNCGELISLSDFKNCRITNKLKKCGVNIEQYRAADEYVRNYLILHKTMDTIIKEQYGYEKFREYIIYLFDRSLPLPKELSDMVLSGEFDLSKIKEDNKSE